METKKNKFLRLAVLEQKKYNDIEKIMSVERKQLTLWWEEFKEEREELSKIRKLWKKKCKDIQFKEFHKWYKSTDRRCHYCKITEEQIFKLIDAKQIVTKRLITRGRTLEIERKEPNKEYDEVENLVFSCYWCNNAKTDEFTEDEFLATGSVIETIWKDRLKKI